MLRLIVAMFLAVLMVACGGTSSSNSTTNAGIPGTPGSTGPTGPTGTPGPTGPTGPTGPVVTNGTLPLKITASSVDSSNDGQTICSKLGWTWDAKNGFCVAAVAKGLEGATGPQGKPGVRFRRGAYGTAVMNPDVVTGDLVRGSGGGVFMALKDNPTSTLPASPPGTIPDGQYVEDEDWSLVMPRGLSGLNGLNGLPGPVGPPGAPGVDSTISTHVYIGDTMVGELAGQDITDGRRHFIVKETWQVSANGGTTSVTMLVRREQNTGLLQTADIYYDGLDCQGGVYLSLSDVTKLLVGSVMATGSGYYYNVPLTGATYGQVKSVRTSRNPTAGRTAATCYNVTGSDNLVPLGTSLSNVSWANVYGTLVLKVE